MAIAVAPVSNWRYYDNIYTERYMRTPAENPSGYDNNAPEKMVKNMQGKYLLIHGTADDNVHFQNAVMLTEALIQADKEFESEYYPDKNHGISGGNTRYHLFNRMTNFILNNL
jgi:dipeptidyl-peptidase-4